MALTSPGSDSEIRGNVLKSMLLNVLSLASIYLFDLLLFPLAKGEHYWLHRNVGWAYQVLWLLPVVGISLYLNVSPFRLHIPVCQEMCLARAPGESPRLGHSYPSASDSTPQVAQKPGKVTPCMIRYFEPPNPPLRIIFHASSSATERGTTSMPAMLR